MSKAQNYQFPTASTLGKRPAWMEGRPLQAEALSLPVHASQQTGSEANGENKFKTKGGNSNPPPGDRPSLAPGRLSIHPDNSLIVQELENRIRAFTQAAVELATAREMVLTSAENQLLDLAVAIAAAIVERELDKDPELYRAFVTEGIRALGATGQVTLKVSRDSYAAIVGVLGGDVANVDGVEVRVASDLSIEGLGCVAESGDSRVDMSLDGRLRAVRRALEDERRRNTEAA